MHFANPDLLHLLWLLIPLALYLFWRTRRRAALLKRIGDPAMLRTIMPLYQPKAEGRRNVIWLLATGLILFALSRPQWGYHLEELKSRGLDIMVALDTSNSMLATDIQPKANISRLQLAKYGLADLSKQLHGDRIGIVAFAGRAFKQCPLTTDYNIFRMSLDDIYAGIIPHPGTAIADALRTAHESFDTAKGYDRVIILISDGEDHDASPEKVIDELKSKNIKVFCLGVGTLDGELIPITDDNGNTQFLKGSNGQVVKTSLNESYLERVAVATGGRYVRSLPGDFGIDRIYEQGILNLKRDEQSSRVIKSYNERFVYFLAGAFILLVFESMMNKRTRRRI
ncbi:MAG: Ca-activated chloride channel family protein [Kiritimatiellia bacterium]|jgi:Ca-activated chloride channel homolog